MAHSGGAVGLAYASGIRGMPGGAAFTLTGVFVDRITPRLLALSGTARAAARGMNAMTPEIFALNQRIQMMTKEMVMQERTLAKYEQRLAKLQAVESKTTNASILKKREKITILEQETAALNANSAALRANVLASMGQMEAYFAITPPKKLGRGRQMARGTQAITDQYRLAAAQLGIDSVVGSGGYQFTTYQMKRMKEVVALYNVYAAKLGSETAAVGRLTKAKTELAASESAVTTAVNAENASREAAIATMQKEMVMLKADINLKAKAIETEEALLAATQYRANAQMYGVAALQSAVRGAGMLGVMPYAAYGMGTFAALSKAGPYSQELSRLKAIGGYTAGQTAGISRNILALGGKYAIPTEEMLGGATTMVKAGVRSPAEMFTSLEAAMKLSIINGEDLQSVMEDLLQLTYAYNLERSKTLEIAANEQTLLNASLMGFEDYMEGMKYAAAWSSKLGISYQETGAALAVLNEAGLQAGLGGRNLRALLTQLAADLETIQTRLEAGGSDMELFFENGKFDLISFLEAIKQNNPTLEDLQWYFKTFNTQGATALLYLTQMTDRLRELTKVQTGSVADLNKTWLESQDNIMSMMQLMKNAINAVFQKPEVIDKLKKFLSGVEYTKMIAVLERFVNRSIEFMSKGGMTALIGMFENLMKLLDPLSKVAKHFANALDFLFGGKNGALVMGILLVTTRLSKMTSVMHQAAAAAISLRLASGASFGAKQTAALQFLNFGHVLPAPGFGRATGAGLGANAMMGWGARYTHGALPAAGAQVAAGGAMGTLGRIGGLVGGGAMAGGLMVGAAAVGTAVILYSLAKAIKDDAEKQKEDLLRKLDEKHYGKEIIVAGNVYGADWDTVYEEAGAKSLHRDRR